MLSKFCYLTQLVCSMQDMQYPSNFKSQNRVSEFDYFRCIQSMQSIHAVTQYDWMAINKATNPNVCYLPICQNGHSLTCRKGQKKQSRDHAETKILQPKVVRLFHKLSNFIFHLTIWRYTLLAKTTLPASQVQSLAILSFPGDQPGICTCSTRVELLCHNQNLCF
jgi:hypothetical protein